MSDSGETPTGAGSFVEWGPRALIYQADGTPLRRQVGFQPPALGIQTSGTFPVLTTPKRKPKKGRKGY